MENQILISMPLDNFEILLKKWIRDVLTENTSAVKYSSEITDIFAKRLIDCNLSIRLVNSCEAYGLYTIGDIIHYYNEPQNQRQLWTIKKLRNFGMKSYKELMGLFSDLDLKLTNQGWQYKNIIFKK